MKIEVPNAIVFVLDPDSRDIEVPEYAGLVSSSRTCVSIGTRADVDGETDITLDRDVSSALTCVFKGEIQTPTGAIAVVTSHMSSLARLEGCELNTKFSVWVDDLDNPSRISVVIPQS